MTADELLELAREYLAGARQRDVNHLPPTRLMVEVTETRRQLAAVLAVAGDQADAVARIRQILAEFQWEFDDRQLALEAIDRIVGGES